MGTAKSARTKTLARTSETTAASESPDGFEAAAAVDVPVGQRHLFERARSFRDLSRRRGGAATRGAGPHPNRNRSPSLPQGNPIGGLHIAFLTPGEADCRPQDLTRSGASPAGRSPAWLWRPAAIPAPPSPHWWCRSRILTQCLHHQLQGFRASSRADQTDVRPSAVSFLANV